MIIDLDTATVREARQMLAKILKDGDHCPCCGRFAKIYRRKLNERIARVLIAMSHKHEAGIKWVYLPSIGGRDSTDVPAARSGEHAFAKHWGLIERNIEEGGRGHWRLTEKGWKFIREEIRVPKYANLYNNRLLWFDSKQTVSVIDVLKTRFIYEELMAGI